MNETIPNPVALGFACGHAKPDAEIHDAGWGARLIYREVEDGYGGLVSNRQGGFGGEELLREKVWPITDEALKAFRVLRDDPRWRGDSERGHIVWRRGRTVVVMSPQQSYGYLYITALLEKEGHEGETHIWDQSEFRDEGRAIANLGNADIAASITATEQEIEWCRRNRINRDHIRKLEAKLTTLRQLA